MLLVRLAGPGARRIAVANVHASTGERARAAADVLGAAGAAAAWAAGLPLVLGGDLNLREVEAPDVFEALERRHGLRGSTGGDAIDHLLVRGLVPVEPPRALPPATREVAQPDGRVVRLSDHPVVAGTFEVE